MIAAAMTVGLTSLYATTVFKSRTYGLRAFGILAGIYGLIYVLMRAESHALLAGALASFAAIALTMYMTRNIEWYGDGQDAGTRLNLHPSIEGCASPQPFIRELQIPYPARRQDASPHIRAAPGSAPWHHLPRRSGAISGPNVISNGLPFLFSSSWNSVMSRNSPFICEKK